jgi:methionyl-tRNA formyltransferase
VHNHIRGLSPYPGAWTLHDGTRLKIYRSRLADGSGTSGTVLAVDDRLVIACGEGAVEVDTLQQPGRQRMEAAAFLNGYDLHVGDHLGA